MFDPELPGEFGYVDADNRLLCRLDLLQDVLPHDQVLLPAPACKMYINPPTDKEYLSAAGQPWTSSAR